MDHQCFFATGFVEGRCCYGNNGIFASRATLAPIVVPDFFSFSTIKYATGEEVPGFAEEAARVEGIFLH
jgi:hypothetical protein